MDLEARHPLSGRIMHFCGTPEGTAHARDDAWRQTLAFLDETVAPRDTLIVLRK